MQITKNYIPEPTAIRFHNDRDNYYYRFIRGVPGSGKSVMCIMECLQWAMAQEPYEGVRRTRFCIVRATYPELKSTTIKTWQDWFPPEIWPVKQSIPYECNVKFGMSDGTKVEMQVYFIAVETEQDVDKLKSFELTGGFVNEASQVDKSVITTLFERTGRYPSMAMGGPTRRGVWADTNSPNDQHWWAKLEQDTPEKWKFYVQPAPLIRKRDSDGRTIGWENNPLAENVRNLKGGHEYYRAQVGGLNDNQLRVAVENLFASTFAGKAVFVVEWDEDMVAKKPLPVDPDEQVLVGIDTSGLNPAAVICQPILGSILTLDEVVEFDCPYEQFLDDALMPLLKLKYKGRHILAIVDPSNPRSGHTGKTALQLNVSRGLQSVPAPSNELILRLDSVKHYMTRRKGMLIDPGCKWLIDGFRGGYAFKQVKGNEGKYTDTPDKGRYSHVQDAYQNVCLYLRRLGKTESSMDERLIIAAKRRSRRGTFRYV